VIGNGLPIMEHLFQAGGEYEGSSRMSTIFCQVFHAAFCLFMGWNFDGKSPPAPGPGNVTFLLTNPPEKVTGLPKKGSQDHFNDEYQKRQPPDHRH
jgi:hypothetical protein